MTTIRLRTAIDAPVERWFDLARSVDLHLRSTSRTRERAVAGVTRGLLGKGDRVTWEAVHFGLRWRMTVRITRFEPPTRFVDEMVRGPFRAMRHVHDFERRGRGTLMRDSFRYVLPLGPCTWYYRVRGLNAFIPGTRPLMSWSAPTKVVVARPTFRVVG